MVDKGLHIWMIICRGNSCDLYIGVNGKLY